MTARRFDHVFVLCTGRCGSLTFARACAHLDNYTAAHESRVAFMGPERLAYPAGHIEVDNRLSWFLGRLDARFGDTAAYVHLTRDPEAVARSYARRQHFGIIRAYGRQIVYRPGIRVPAPPDEALALARDYVETVTANIAAFLQDKSHVLHITLETIGTDFSAFCDWTGATGDMARAQRVLTQRHNATRSERKTP